MSPPQRITRNPNKLFPGAEMSEATLCEERYDAVTGLSCGTVLSAVT